LAFQFFGNANLPMAFQLGISKFWNANLPLAFQLGIPIFLKCQFSYGISAGHSEFWGMPI
jgi:hypothetical protein